ncbi:hypothetical protein [Shewanella fidelis]|uniref:hypothetical protein n=1 Tax=Shewanella fidelis TaxID=173509 RepID=UPI00048AA280|nr:hypothetical protein [Shewanella fidelis]
MKSLLPLIFGSAVLVGCGGSDSDSPLSDSIIAETVKCTNLAEGGLCSQNVSNAWGQMDLTWATCNSLYCFEDGSEPDENPNLTRWREGELIPVYFLNSEDPRFTYAMNKAEELVGYKLFDRKGVINLDISNIYNIDYSSVETKWGFIWSQGTALDECSSGTVSTGPMMNSIVNHSVGLDYGINQPVGNTFSWINLDSGSATPETSCTNVASNEVTLHELAHALGMSNHFDGFGDGAAFNNNAERVLRTMYSNPPGQPFDALSIAQ